MSMDAEQNRVGIVSPGEVYENHAVELTRFATSLVGPTDAPDVVHDAVVSLISSGRLAEADNPRALMYRAVLAKAHSMHRSVFRRRSREQRFAASLTAVDPERDPEVTAALVRLSPQQRACVWLAYWEDLDVARIAARLGIAEGTVKSHLARARERLRRVIGETA